MAAIRTEPCVHCGGEIRYMPVDKRVDRHTRRDCPGKPPRYAPKGITAESKLESFRQVFATLTAHAEEHGIDGLARWDWPRDARDPTALMTIREQLVALRSKLTWQVRDNEEAKAMVRAITDLVEGPQASFRAPPLLHGIPVHVPWVIHLAIQRLHQAGRIPINPEDLPTDGSALSRDARMLALWLEGQPTDTS